MFKKSILLLTVILLSLYSEAQNVSGSDAFEVAQSFMAKKGVTLNNDDKAGTRGNEPYSIYKGIDGKGFAIVVNGAVVGYSTENGFGSMPDALREMLESYSSQVATTRGTYPEWFTPRNVEPIEPLITTHWSQKSPYNDLTDRKSGICVSIAYSQILHYYRLKACLVELSAPQYPESGVLPPTTFNHDLILDEYTGNESEESRREVARFIQYCQLAFKEGANFEEAFDIERYCYTRNINEYNTFKHILGTRLVEDVYEFLDSCLERGMPVMSYSSNHAYIIDGRDSEGRYHVNYGWGGHKDGYYAFGRERTSRQTSGGFEAIAFTLLEVHQPSSIESVSRVARVDGVVYDLYGRKVGNSMEGLPRGVYIMNGKKFVNKYGL